MASYVFPEIIYGTSGLGNLYTVLEQDVKESIVSECMKHSSLPAVFDTAGKYGAGLALESLALCLKNLGIRQDEVVISNKLGWLRVPLTTPDPTFEPGVWKNLRHDAIQKISYEGILQCYRQGNELLGDYRAGMVSVHDPDEYLQGSATEAERERRYQDILDAYRALQELKVAGEVSSIGVGAKDWRAIQKIAGDVRLDWVMFANSMTIHSHPKDLIRFMEELDRQGVQIINSAIFNGGFLTGSDYYNYQPVNPESRPELYTWRTRFYELCRNYGLAPAAACTAFALTAPGVDAIALNTTNPERVGANHKLKDTAIPANFWHDMRVHHLIDHSYPI